MHISVAFAELAVVVQIPGTMDAPSSLTCHRPSAPATGSKTNTATGRTPAHATGSTTKVATGLVKPQALSQRPEADTLGAPVFLADPMTSAGWNGLMRGCGNVCPAGFRTHFVSLLGLINRYTPMVQAQSDMYTRCFALSAMSSWGSEPVLYCSSTKPKVASHGWNVTQQLWYA